MNARALALAWLSACGAASPPSAPPPHAEPVDAAVAPAPELDAGPPDPFDTLRSELAPREATVLSTLGHALDECPPRGDECAASATAIWDGGRWIVLDVDASEGGAESFALWSSTPAAESELARGDLDRAGQARFRSATRAWRTTPPPEDRIGTAATTAFSSSELVTLVSLTAPLDGWLWIQTATDLDHPAHTLTLVRVDGSRVPLGEHVATLGPCDGDGMTCASTDWEACTAEQLREENRLCVLPVGITSVSLAPDGSSIAILGIEAVAGDGGYPAFHWVVAWPTFGGP